jgi:hypothetical protein
MYQPKEEITLESIDFEWVNSQTKKGPLKTALKILHDDGNSFELKYNLRWTL